MDVQEIRTYIKISIELKTLCESIFNYVKSKYKDQLKFGIYSSYSKYFINEKELCIEYFEHCRDYCDEDYLPYIPIELLEKESYWKQFLDTFYENKAKEEEQKKIKEEQAKEDKERELYEKLKQKYEICK